MNFAASLLAHLWQSTAFAAAAWILALALTRHRATVRFWIWTSASIKFLVPFALLSELGTRWAAQRLPHQVFYTLIEEFNQPLATARGGALRPVNWTPFWHNAWMPWALGAIWLLGFIWVSANTTRHWLRAHKVVRGGRSLESGPEITALRSGEAELRIRKPLPCVVTIESIEPGVFGIVRPVLLWPAGLSERLDKAQLRAIVAHELEHVRRHDNLISAVHSITEALFWFHPPVRWIGKKMNEERERACDESVIAQRAEPETYAESILKVCTFCLESPLQCVAGISGSDLRMRVLRIVSGRPCVNLTFGTTALLIAFASLAIGLPIGYGVVHGQSAAVSNPGATDDAAAHTIPKYDVASIKPRSSDPGPSFFRLNPDGTSIHNIALQFLLREAFGVESDRIIGAPAWVQSNRYDIEAKVAPEDAPLLDKLKAEDRRAMLIPLLVERFNLKYHHETRELPMYVLVVAKGGSKLQASTPRAASEPAGSPFAGNPPKGIDTRGRMMMAPGRVESQDTTLDMLAHVLAPQLGRSVVDKTGLTGRYDYTLQWTPDNAPPPMPGAKDGAAMSTPETDASGASLFTAIQEQLGLKLEAEKGKVDVIVIDHIDQPSPN